MKRMMIKKYNDLSIKMTFSKEDKDAQGKQIDAKIYKEQ